VLFGFGPAASQLRSDMQRPLKEDGGGSSVASGRLRVRAALAALEVAMAIVLLSGPDRNREIVLVKTRCNQDRPGGLSYLVVRDSDTHPYCLGCRV
jgi:hypothetical protein